MVMRMKKSDSKFGAPVGINYVGRFLGIFPFGDGTPRVGRDGKPMGPAVEWQFEITADPDHDGEYVGQMVGRITAAEPTTRNSCGALLGGLVGREVGTDEDVDENEYVGQLYQLVIVPSPQNPEKTYVAQIHRAKGQNGARPAPPAPRAAPKAPPARPAAPTPPARPAPPKAPARPAAPAPAPLPGAKQPDPEPTYWFSYDGGEPISATATDVRREIQAGTYRPELMQWSHPGSPDNWQPVAGSWLMDPNQQPPF